MGHRGLSPARAADEQLVVGRVSGLCGWAHLASYSRSPFSSITHRTGVVCDLAPGTPISSDQFDISRSVASDQWEKNPINDLFYVLRRQRLLEYHELIAPEVERQRSQSIGYGSYLIVDGLESTAHIGGRSTAAFDKSTSATV